MVVLLKFYDCLVFSRIINSYPLVAVIWIFGGSNNLDSMFLFSCQSAVIVNKKNQGCCCGGIFCLYFSDATLLAALLQKRSDYVNVILFRIACYTKNIQNCPPKDIFKKFERKAHNHSTLVRRRAGILDAATSWRRCCHVNWPPAENVMIKAQ